MRVVTQPVEIRAAEEDDLHMCLALDDSYTSTHTWQVESVRDGNGTSSMARLQAYKSADLVLMAEQGPKLCGYLVLTMVPGSGIGWISALVVANSMRRQGVGSMLMAAARRWGRYGQGQNLRAFMLEVPTKNFPAVAFCRKEGFHLCGYTDYSFSNGDVVLLFVSPVVI
jgi:ribosomal protein S18 acetylase RimI-like enzyme